MITISLTSPVPLQEQIASQLRRLIATGNLGIGDELPPVRQLANDLGINLNTVARAYRELTDAGLLTSTRGRGTIVIAAVEKGSGRVNDEKQRIKSSLAEVLSNSKIAGFTLNETREFIEEQIAKIWNTMGAKS